MSEDPKRGEFKPIMLHLDTLAMIKIFDSKCIPLDLYFPNSHDNMIEESAKEFINQLDYYVSDDFLKELSKEANRRYLERRKEAEKK